MTDYTSFSDIYNERLIQVREEEDAVFLSITEVTPRSDRDEVIAYVSGKEAHALADWIIENVPKPEKPVPPTAFGAIVRSSGKLYTLVEPDAVDEEWRAADGEWVDATVIREQGFEVLFEGVANEELP